MTDLLKLQENFKNSNKSPSAKISRKSLFSQRSEKLKLSDSITSKDSLFGCVLSEVVERNYEEIGVDREFHRQGFPTALHRSHNSTKFGVSHPKNEKNSTQPGDPEYEKLRWTIPVEENTSLPGSGKSQLRFNFMGKVVQDTAENMENSGLFHHGEEHSIPGYTIGELVHLSKSTVPAQRVVALRSLTRIVKNLYNGDFEGDSMSVYLACKEQPLLLAARIGMDSSHLTVVDNSLAFIVAYIGCSEIHLDLYDIISNTIAGKKTLAIEKNSLLAFTHDPSKLDDDVDASMAGIIDALRNDPLLGLLMTQIIARIRFLLKDELALIERKLNLILILSKLAIHSASSSEDIMSCDGLVDILNIEIFKLRLPLLEEGNKSEYLCSLLRLVRILCSSSKEAAVAFMKLGFFQNLMRFISIFNLEYESLFRIQFQVFLLLNVCLSYGISPSILDEFHSIIFQNGEFFFKALCMKTNDLHLNKAAVSWTNFLHHSLLLFRKNLNPGGENDAFFSFVEVAAKLLTISVHSFLNIKKDSELYLDISSASLRFITSYLVLSDTQLIPLQSKSLNDLLLDIIPVYAKHMPTIIPPVPLDSVVEEVGMGILQKSRLCYALDLCYLSNHFDSYSSLCLALNYCVRKKSMPNQEFLEIVQSAKLSLAVEILLQFSFNCRDWLTNFSHGIVYFLNEVLTLSEVASPLNYVPPISLENSHRLSWYMLQFLIPGDEWILQKCLNRLKLSEDSFLKKIFTDDVLSLSKSFHSPSPSAFPPYFLMDSKSYTVLPLREFWCYEFPVTLIDNSLYCSLVDLLSWLNFVEKVSSQQPISFKSYHLYCIMNVFLLKDKDGDYHFLEPVVSSLIAKILNRIAIAGSNLSEFHRLYPLFIELLDHYQAVSYGDSVFGKCLLLLCQTSFPFDFRLAFWSRMKLYLNHFQFDCGDVFGNFENYICPKEENKDVLKQKILAKNSLKLFQSEKSAVWNILQH